KQPDVSLASVAAVLEELKQPAAAEELYRRYLRHSKDPRAALVLASFLGRQHRLHDALALCEQAWQSCPPEQVGTVSVSVLRGSSVGEADCARVERWLDEALLKARSSENGKKPAALLLTCLAEVRNLRGRHAESEALYRQVLEIDSNNVVAL